MLEDRIAEQVRAVALTSDSRRRIGCVLLRRGRVFISSTNVEGKTHPTQARLATMAGEPYRTSLHAEIRALLKEGSSKCDTLIVGRVNKKGEFCMSKPCPVCQLAIRGSGIRKVYYSTSQGSWETLRLT